MSWPASRRILWSVLLELTHGALALILYVAVAVSRTPDDAWAISAYIIPLSP